jgi:hypothetical protein
MIMNAPPSESEKKARELAAKFLDENYITFKSSGRGMRTGQVFTLAALLLHCHKEGAQGQRVNFGWSSDPSKSVTFRDVPFNVTWPVTDQQTLPNEIKK